jgi:hypothetical protein
MHIFSKYPTQREVSHSVVVYPCPHLVGKWHNHLTAGQNFLICKTVTGALPQDLPRSARGRIAKQHAMFADHGARGRAAAPPATTAAADVQVWD